MRLMWHVGSSSVLSALLNGSSRRCARSLRSDIASVLHQPCISSACGRGRGLFGTSQPLHHDGASERARLRGSSYRSTWGARDAIYMLLRYRRKGHFVPAEASIFAIDLRDGLHGFRIFICHTASCRAAFPTAAAAAVAGVRRLP